MLDTAVNWEEARFYVMRTLERLEDELKEKTAALARHEDREEKAREDLNQAHARIRTLQSAARTAWWKMWAPIVGVLALELLRFVLKRGL